MRKLLLLFYIVILIYVLVSCEKEYVTPAGCIDKSKIVPYIDRVCTMEVEYVCGCDGLLYINTCHAEVDGITNTWPATLQTNCKS